VVHSFDGSPAELRSLLELPSLSVGINGCSLRTEANLQVAASVPLGRLLLETDAPWCDIRQTHAGE
jgi:TatD DNase family protein